jgi:tetratricopeptide (TPR) repeat protein
MISESTSFPASKSVSKPALKNKITTEQKFGRTQQLTVIDKSMHQSEKQNLPEKPTDEGSIKEYLAAAKKAMKAVRLTTPLRDNAYKYYQMVLALDPGNAEALAGLQKIVDRYVWFLQKERAEGNLDKAKRALQKAESVLPDDPKLHTIRAELAFIKE